MNYATSTYTQESLKLIICGLFYRNISVTKTIKSALDNLIKMYDSTSEKIYLETGYAYICAYVDLGFSYFELEPEANNVLKKLNLREDIEFSKKKLVNTRIPLTRSKLNKMIGRWPASIYNSHKKNDVINDIVTKITLNQLGEYIYYTSSNASKTNASYYKLIITKDNAFFHNISKQHFYIIEKPDFIGINSEGIKDQP